jgi:cbb3-type cytochrome oxidase subunit 1
MPRLSAWAIRASLIYMILGFTFGGLMLWNKGIPLDPLLWRFLPLHIDFLLFGWVLQLIIGVAFWILPRFSRGTQRGNIKMAWFAFLMLNTGIWLVSLAGLGLPNGLTQSAILAGRLAEAAAVLAFTFHAWPRVKAAGA